MINCYSCGIGIGGSYELKFEEFYHTENVHRDRIEQVDYPVVFDGLDTHYKPIQIKQSICSWCSDNLTTRGYLVARWGNKIHLIFQDGSTNKISESQWAKISKGGTWQQIQELLISRLSSSRVLSVNTQLI